MIKEIKLFVQPLTFEELKEFIKSNNIYTDISKQGSKFRNYVKSNHKIINKFVKLIENYKILGKPDKAEIVLNLFNEYVKIETVSTFNLKDNNSLNVKIYDILNIFYNVNYDKLSSGLGRLITDLEKVTTVKRIENYINETKRLDPIKFSYLVNKYSRRAVSIDKKLNELTKKNEKLNSDIVKLEQEKEMINSFKSHFSSKCRNINVNDKEVLLEEF